MITMSNNTYWDERFTQLEEAQYRKAVLLVSEIAALYRSAQKQIEAEIDKWYRRFAKNNNISLADARQWLTGKDLKEFKWDVWDYIKYGRENAINHKWMKELENASAKFHISRLEAIKIHIQQSIEALYGKQLNSIDAAMREVYINGYYHTAFEVQKGVGVGWDFSSIDESVVSKVISKPWAVDGRNFSSRIWGNKEKLIQTLHKELTQSLMLGKSPQGVIDNISKIMNTTKNNAERLVLTESAYFHSVAQKDSFKKLGVEQYRIVISYDEKTCEICQSLEGKIFDIKDHRPGVTAPPFHVRCRCNTVPDTNNGFDSFKTKAARDSNGKTIFIPKTMTYKEWEEKFVTAS